MSGYDGRGGKFDIIAVRGADLSFTVTATDSLSAAIDLSAATITGELYTATGAVAATLSDAVSGAGSNIITLSATDAQTALWTEASYPWTLWVTRGGDKRPWLAGRVRVVDSSNGVRATDGDAITLTVDSDVNVSVAVAVVGGTGGGVDTSGVPVANDIARFTDADTIEGRSYSELRSDLGLVVGTDVQAYSSVLAATTASFTTTDESKLDGIEALADVTDATNVAAAGAVMALSTVTKINGPITQAAYDLLTPASDTLYVIVG